MYYAIGSKEVTFRGREPFEVTDNAFKQDLISRGIFSELGDGTMKYTGDYTVLDSDDTEHKVNEDGFINIAKSNLKIANHSAFEEI